MNNKICLVLALPACALVWAAKDPVIMTVNGVDVPKSEFEYLYHKNSQQQLSPQPLEEYAEMFKIYKLKVADAKAAGIDTTASFRREMAQYRKELARPYITDSLFINSLIEEEVERGKTDVETSHIMLLKGKTASENKRVRARIDSIRARLLEGEDFTEMALKLSEDRSVEKNKGNLGYIVAGRYPYAFESMAYATPEGQISEVVESPVGFHIIKGGKRRPSKGRIRASHIMKMVPQNATEEQRRKAKSEIDSLYEVVKANPDMFAEVAKNSSDDKGSAVNGGDLTWFGPGDMVPEFENAAFALSDGEISRPVLSGFGWHIIKRTGTKGSPSFDEIKDVMGKRLQSPQDPRKKMIRDNERDKLASKHKASIDKGTFETLKGKVGSTGIDSLFFASYTTVPMSEMTIATIDGNKITVGEYAGKVSKVRVADPDEAVEALEATLDNFYYGKLVEAEENWLYENNPAYKNLLDEYHDGSLLYEISLRNVWDKAAKDTEGLKAYFDANKGNYTWTNPRAKGILVQTKGDSLAAVIKSRMAETPSDSIIPKLRKEFQGKASLERVLVEKGVNAMVDNVMFGGPEVKPSNSRYDTYFLFGGRVIEAPEEVGDVRGQVTSDYQNELESRWVGELKKKYKVKVNGKELKKVK